MALCLVGAVCARAGPDRLGQASRFREAGRCFRAVEIYEEVITRDPSQVEAYRGLVSCYGVLGDAVGALTFLETVYLEHPESAGVLYGMGYAHYEIKDYEKALAYFEKALEKKPDLAEAWNNCAVIHHFVRKDYEKARACYEKAVHLAKIQGNDRVLKIALENLSHLPEPVKLRPLTRPLTLEEFLDRAVAAAEAGDVRHIRELVLGQKENAARAVDWLLDRALDAWGRSRESEEKNAVILAKVLGRHYYKAFEEDGPEAKVAAYENLAPRDKDARVRAGRLLESGFEKERKGLWAEAAQDFREAASRYERLGDRRRSGFAWKGLGDARRALKAYPEAVKSYDRALRYLKAAGEEAEAARVLSALGITWYHLERPERSIRFFKQSLEAFERMKDEAGARLVRRNLEALGQDKQEMP